MDRQLEQLPGGELILAGLEDLRAGRTGTLEALLVAIAAPRLRSLGLPVPELPAAAEAHELELYRLLRVQAPQEAYSRYNALLRRLVSFEQALEQQVYRAARLRRQR